MDKGRNGSYLKHHKSLEVKSKKKDSSSSSTPVSIASPRIKQTVDPDIIIKGLESRINSNVNSMFKKMLGSLEQVVSNKLPLFQLPR